MKDQNDRHLNAVRRVLAEVAQVAEHGSLTGSYRGGARAAAQAYNGALAALSAKGLVPEGMFESLDLDHADFGHIGVQARLLLAVVEEPEEEAPAEEGLGSVIALAPFLNSQDLAQLVRERLRTHTKVNDGFLTALAPFLDSEMLGELVRTRMNRRPAAPEPAPAPAPPSPPEPPQDIRPAIHEAPPATLESLADELRRPDLTVEERQAIATRLAELSYDQSVRALE